MHRVHDQLPVAWVVAACVLFAAAVAPVRAAPDAPGSVDRFALRPVAVETLGFAPMGEGVPASEAHAAALADARRNAVIQAHAALQAETLVANRRVAEEVIRVRSAGYVQEMQVLDSGVVPASDPPLYQVRVRALVHPLDESRVGPLAAVEALLTPVISLDVASADGPALRDALNQELTRCGMRVVEATGTQPAIAAHVAVLETTELSAPGLVWWQGMLGEPAKSALKVQWDMTVGRAGDPSVPAASGQCLLPADAELRARVLPHLSVAMAQAALRLWCTPRATRVLFRGASEAEARALTAAARNVSLTATDGAPRPEGGVLLNLLLAGSPTAAVRSIQDRAGLEGRFVLSQGSLTDLAYVRAPEPAEAEANAP